MFESNAGIELAKPEPDARIILLSVAQAEEKNQGNKNKYFSHLKFAANYEINP